MPQTTLIESATYTTCVPHVARISNVESVLFGIREDLEGNSLEECVMDLLVTGTSICCFILIDLFSAGERTLYSERNPRRTPRPSLPQPRYTLTEIDKKRCQALTAKKMTYPLLVGETTAMMWNASGHGWNPLEKIMCSVCLRKEFQRRFWFGL